MSLSVKFYEVVYRLSILFIVGRVWCLWNRGWGVAVGRVDLLWIYCGFTVNLLRYYYGITTVFIWI
jgi:hypothetical protein